MLHNDTRAQLHAMVILCHKVLIFADIVVDLYLET